MAKPRSDLLQPASRYDRDFVSWTREQAINYAARTSGNPGSDVAVEIDRYIAWPGQALAYKIGRLTILRLRKKAQAELGDKFDIRAFHDEVLGAGALPMDVLEKRIDTWIERTKRATSRNLQQVLPTLHLEWILSAQGLYFNQTIKGMDP